jgi:hypothetical protein
VITKALTLCLLLVLSLAGRVQAEELSAERIWGSTELVHDALFTPESLFVATSGGLQEFNRTTRQLVYTYTTRDGLPVLEVQKLGRKGPSGRWTLVATTNGSSCLLSARRFHCRPVEAERSSADDYSLNLAYHHGTRVTVKLRSGADTFVGTVKGGWLNGTLLPSGPSLSARHVTSLAIFQEALWVGTFNEGIVRETRAGGFAPISFPTQLINALSVGKRELFVGTSDGLYRTNDGKNFRKESFVQGAVVGLAFDGISTWAATPGALYRVQETSGPRTDVWWIPGGSRSLQKLSFSDGFLWLGTEDRGALRMPVTPNLVSKDRVFARFDKTHGLASSWSLAAAGVEGGGAMMTTLREGLTFIYPNGRFQKLPDSASPWGLSALTDGGHVWVGTQGGAVRLSLTDSKATRVSGLPDERFHAFLRDTRREFGHIVWIGTEGGLAAVPTTQPASSVSNAALMKSSKVRTAGLTKVRLG